jgi:hypothetical protein
MKRIFIAILTTLTIVSCSSDSESTTVDSALPVGAFYSYKTGNCSNPQPKENWNWCRQSKYNLCTPCSLTTELGTGTTSVYLSTSNTFKASPGTGNPDLKLIGIVTKKRRSV